MTPSALLISTMTLVAVLGCGGRESGTNASTSGGGGFSAGMDASTASDLKVPLYHRATAASCPSQRGPGTPNLQPICPTPPPPSSVCCSSDSQCDGGINGRCIDLGHAGQQCTYDECSNDSDCPSGTPCICRGSSPIENAWNTC